MEDLIKPDIEIEPELEKPEELVEVDIGKKEPIKLEPKSVTPEDLDKLHRRLEYNARQFEKKTREMEQALQSIQELAKPKKPEGEMDELDKLAEKDWKKAVKVLGYEAAREVLAEVQRGVQSQQKESWKSQELEGSRNRVRDRYPEVDDEKTETAKLFMECQGENPSFLTNMYGPELTMYKMEEKMRQRGQTPPIYRQVVDREVERRSRVGAGAIPAGRGTTPGKVVLTREQLEFCKNHNLPVDQYAKNLQRLEAGEPIEGDQ